MNTRSNHMAGRPGSMQSRLVLVLTVTAAVAVYACNSTPTPPTSPPTPPDGGTTTPNTPGGSPTVKPGVTTLCKFGPGGRFVVSVGVTGANPTTKAVTVDDGACVDVATVDPARRDDVIVAIAENAVAFAALEHIDLQQGDGDARSIRQTSLVSFEGTHGAVVTYHNSAVVTLCKVGLSGTFQYQVGPADTFHDLSLPGGQCAMIAAIPPAARPDDVIVTVRENASASYRLDHITLVLGEGDVAAPRTVTGTSSLSFEGLHGGVVTFFNVAP
jgi:hypothetical protein